MNTFKRKALFTAVLAGLGAAGTAEAVYLNPNNTGQVLVYPYYTVQRVNNNAFNTYLSVVNTTTRAKAVKVRILEGKTSAEVLDFNLFLSPNDMWTAVIESSDPTSDTAAARIFTRDTSCTNPVGQLRADLGGTGELFRNFVLIENAGGVGLPGTGVERTREGYVEFIEMGTLTGTWATAVTHGSTTGVPANCAVVQTDAAPTSIEAPTGGLVGTGTLINVNNGQDMTYKADALEAWRETAFYSPPAFLSPSLQDADPAISLVVNAGAVNPLTGASTELTAYRTTFAALAGGPSPGARAVASVFMHASVVNEYVLDAPTGSLTDWVITQPLKTPYFVTSATARPPYSNLLTSSGACEAISFTFFNREERGATATGSDFSPPAPGQALDTLCWESTILSIRNGATHMPASGAPSGVLGSRNVRQVSVGSFESGWARLTFTGPGASATGMGGTAAVFDASTGSLDAPTLTPGVAVTFFGLPVTGFAVRTFSNGTLTCGTAACQGNYGGLFQHSYINRITP